MARTHHLPDEQVHFTWDTGNEPRVVVGSGDTVVVWTRDVSDNQIGPESDVSVIAGLDWERVYPLLGPIGVHGAEPGDTLAIEVLDIRTQGWGWTAVLPGLGLLPEDFPDAYLRVFDLSHGEVAYLRDDIATPLEPFFGTMGVCPAGATAEPVMPPGIFGGNMDARTTSVARTPTCSAASPSTSRSPRSSTPASTSSAPCYPRRSSSAAEAGPDRRRAWEETLTMSGFLPERPPATARAEG